MEFDIQRIVLRDIFLQKKKANEKHCFSNLF